MYAAQILTDQQWISSIFCRRLFLTFVVYYATCDNYIKYHTHAFWSTLTYTHVDMFDVISLGTRYIEYECDWRLPYLSKLKMPDKPHEIKCLIGIYSINVN